jgi:hypothetical protein
MLKHLSIALLMCSLATARSARAQTTEEGLAELLGRDLTALSLNRSATEIRLDRQFSMPSVKQDCKLHGRWTPVANQRIKCRPNRSSCENQIPKYSFSMPILLDSSLAAKP